MSTAAPSGQDAAVSIVVPARDAQTTLEACLDALARAPGPSRELIVVDDRSSDRTADLARAAGARVLSSGGPGPAAARNTGAAVAQSAIILFVDADVVIRPDALARIVRRFEGAEPAAVFGSYDAHPGDPGFVSQYRNLLHHFTHQHAAQDSGSFWAGFGAIRREVFLSVGGFDAKRFPRPSIEDIELGRRLRRAGHRIVLDPAIQATHLKRWTFGSMVRTDVRDRAIPWSRLILESPTIPDDLNLKRRHRVSAVFVWLAILAVLLAVAAAAAHLPRIAPLGLLVFGAAAALGSLWIDRALYRFLAAARGASFAVRAAPLHLFYYVYSSAAFAACWTRQRILGRAGDRPPRRRDENAGGPAPVP